MKIPGATGTLIIAKGKITVKSTIDCVIREDSRTVFEEVGFFAPESVGLEVKLVDKRIRIVKMRDESPLAKAGLKPGDSIVSVDGVIVESTAQFRALLLERVLAQRGTIILDRNGKRVTTTIEFKVN